MKDSAESEFLNLVLANPINQTLLERLAQIALPDWYLTAGCLFQTVWNKLSGFSPQYGINDYDVFYYDNDVSWDAENKVIKRCNPVFSDLDAEVQIRNQARVHLWYEEKYGERIEPLLSSRDGIDHFLNQSSCFGVRKAGGNYEVYAPFGFTDLFSLTTRPNVCRHTSAVYYAKTDRWRATWPDLHVIPWPDPTSDGI